MNIHYALYDPLITTHGNFWTGTAPEFPLVRRFYLDFAVKHLPPKPNDLQETDIWGGLVRLADWTVVYRYFNGAWDNTGRPGRYVLLTAWIPAKEAQGYDLLPILTNKTFQYVAENAEDIPVPQPLRLKEDWTATKITAAPFQEGQTPFTDTVQAMRVFAGVPSTRKAKYLIADVKIIKTAKEQQCVLNVVHEPLLPPSPQSLSKTEKLEKTMSASKPEKTRPPFVLPTKIVAMIGAPLLCVACVLVYINQQYGGGTSQSALPSLQEKIKDDFRALSFAERNRLLVELQQIHGELGTQYLRQESSAPQDETPKSGILQWWRDRR